jgi:membrane peptidoglycan carboxypeptidase
MSGTLRTLQKARTGSTLRARAGSSGHGSRAGGYPFAVRTRPHGRSPITNLVLVLGVMTLAGVLTIAGALGAAAITTVAAVGALSDGLPDPSQLADMTFEQPTIVYDRSGEVELGRFQRVQRRVVTYDQIPKLVLDTATTAEDRTFWTNEGVDPTAILSAVAENASGESDRGASTITQQLVRARLLPEEDTAPGADRYLRKAKEIIQSLRLTGQFPGEQGKQTVVTAYLNEIFYGHDAYGVAAAARIYFGVTDLAKLTPAQAALLAGLPKSPSNFDPYQYAVEEDGKLVVPPTAPPVQRRDYILQNLNTSRWTHLSPAALQQALDEPVILAGEQPLTFRAAQFTYQVRRQLELILGSRDALETGGYRVITTLDWRAQRLAEKWLSAAVIAPNLPAKQSARLLAQLKVPSSDRSWIGQLRGKDLHNAALVALDYRTGDVRAYAGSAGYYRDAMASREFEPKFDVAGDGTRQPGSAWKPILYATAFEQKKLTPGSVLLDITTRFGSDWAPRDADSLERGPVLVRKALQYSLNIPAIRTLQRVGNAAVAKQAEKMGIRFPGGTESYLQAGLAGAIGTVEVKPLELTSAYGVFGNGGVRMPPRMILEVQDSQGHTIWKAPQTDGEQALSPQTAFLISDILQGNTDRKQNPIWAAKLTLSNGPHGSRRPAAVKTGTANDAKDLATYGFLPKPSAPDEPGYAVGIWMGNSDHSMPRSSKPATSLDAAAPLWRAFVRDLTKGQPVARFERPSKVTKARIDAWTGGKPGPWTRFTIPEFFIAGTQPGGDHQIDRNGLLYVQACGTWQVDPLKAELGPRSWDDDVANWIARARHGVGQTGPLDSRTAYFWDRSSWGGQIVGACPRPKPTPVVAKPPRDHGPGDKPPREPGPKPPKPPKPPGHGGGGGHGDGGGGRGG